ncbi:MAG: diadenylate cyclase [Thermodesulfobacteriota bacterium]|nr:diadenylate cyclase [Thermodesulfobacteriota bacterium]
MKIFAIIANLRFQDLLDILFLTVVAYHLYFWFRETKAFKALVGLLVLGIVFTVARAWGLFLTTWAFQILWQVLIILLVILFQSEIRQALERVNPLQVLGLKKITRPEEWIQQFAQAVFALAKKRIGALIIIERRDRVRESITQGQLLEGEPNFEMLMSIFQKESPLHDGAVLIQDGRLTQVASYLPISPDERLPKEWGTRHRAALGLTERCDAWVVVVSEERGEVSLARKNEMIRADDPQRLVQLILEATTPFSPPRKRWPDKIRFFLVNRCYAKVVTLFVISILWLLLAGQQDFEVSLNVPLRFRNMPSQMDVIAPVNPMIEIRVRGLRKDASTLSEKNVLAEMDLSLAQFGQTTFPVNRDHISISNDRISIVDIEPSQIAFTFKAKQ